MESVFLGKEQRGFGQFDEQNDRVDYTILSPILSFIKLEINNAGPYATPKYLKIEVKLIIKECKVCILISTKMPV